MPMFARSILFVPLAMCICGAVQAQETSSQAATTGDGADSTGDTTASSSVLDEMHIYGRGLKQIGQSQAASEGTVGYDDLANRPILRIGELAESVPGLIATQHSGGGKANQYFLRGFNLDHGTDFSVAFDGMPVNIRSHAHGQGYLDLNFMIPEVVERIDYAKGVYRADTGDFSAAGSARFRTYDTLDNSFATAEVGSYNYQRAAVGVSRILSMDSSLLVAGEFDHEDGPWTLPQNLHRYKGYAKWTHDTEDATIRVSLFGFQSTWDATDQIPLRAVESGLTGRYGYIDPNSGGRTWRYGATVSVDAGNLSLNAYASRYGLNLFSNATYFQDNPVNGDAIEQADRRWVIGAKARNDWQVTLGGADTDVALGMDVQGDIMDQVGLFHVKDRMRFATVRNDRAQEYSFEPWLQVESHLTDTLRLMLGLRDSVFTGTADSHIAANSGSADANLLQPKISLAWQVVDTVELYASAGRGFHSNSILGATTHIDPATGDLSTPAPLLVKATGGEVGARIDTIPNMKLTVAAFLLDLDSELIFVGDAGTSEPSSGTPAAMAWRPRSSGPRPSG